MGQCGVRGNVGGELYSFNFGKSVEATMEYIETEAVNHFAPGAKILSLGNIGCMMSCDFCQNWRTSQVRHLKSGDVRRYTPEEIIETCKKLGINVISWTYNDPVVWHEFVVTTSRLAQKEGIVTLYKSAFYIEPEAVDELIDCIDIFSISLKSMDEKFYRKFTGGTHLKPVLDMIKKVHDSGRHLEISQLLITGRNDNEEEISRTNNWVLANVGNRVPLHYVAFHPAYLYTDVARTDESILIKAREMALDAGISYCYCGNLFDDGVSNTHCPKCGTITISRYGLKAQVVALDKQGCCTKCGTQNDVRAPYLGQNSDEDSVLPTGIEYRSTEFLWSDEANSVHIEVSGDRAEIQSVLVDRIGGGETAPQKFKLGGVLRRVIASRQSDNEKGVLVTLPKNAEVHFFPVLDRAHFPTSEDLDREMIGYREENALLREGAE
jgi:pyruvate formate lyase activating enzyme